MKTVVFTQRVEVIESYNERRDCADQRISSFIFACGYLPVPLPNNPVYVGEIIKQASPAGIMLTGGNSLVIYGGNAPERDETDRLLIDIAIRNKLPLYGFCRGMQSLLDYFGEKLQNVQNHVAVRHKVSGEISRTTNSYHNQACVSLKSCELEVLSKSDDGIIEAIRHKSLPLVATMWHPERESPFVNDDIHFVQKLFK